MKPVDARLAQSSVLVVSHVTDLSGPTEALAAYLAPRTRTLGLIYHPFYYCRDVRSRGSLFQRGQETYASAHGDQRLPEVLTFFKALTFTIFYLLRFRRRWDLYIGVNPLNAVPGIFLRWLGLVRRVVLYTIDWMPRRFESRWLNTLYHAIDRLAARHSDYVWNLSSRICGVRGGQGLPPERNLLVPVGVEDNRMAQPAQVEAVKGRGKLVLLGALAPSKGVDLVIKSFPDIQRAFPWVELVVIGRTPINAHEDGEVFEPYEGKLQSLGPAVKLMGALPHYQVMRIMPYYGIGLAPYATTAGNLSVYADPSRVKDYLACGLPVVITPVPEIAFQVERERAGILVEDNEASFVAGVGRLLSDEALYWEMRQNALRLAAGFHWQSIFAQALMHVMEPG